MADLYTAQTATVNTVTSTITHALGTGNTPRVRITPLNVAAATAGIYVVSSDSQTVQVRAGLDACLVQIEVLSVHSIQGGP